MSSTESNTATATSAKANQGCTGCFAWIFGLMFFGVGLAFAAVLIVFPLWGMLQARNWVLTPCQVVSSKLEQDDGTSRVVVVYSYTFGNQPYQSDRYCFQSMSSNTSRDWKRQVIAAHPPGARTNCYVNPGSPAQAVIERGWVPDMWWGLFPLPFTALGCGVLLYAVGVWRVPQSRDGTSEWRPARSTFREADSMDVDMNTGPVTLKPAITPFQNLIIAVCIALFWNGITSIFVWQFAVQVIRGGFAGWDWIPTLFLLPFVAIGLGLICFVVYSLLAIFNPRPTLVVNSEAIRLGERLTVNWSLSGRTESIRELKISLKGAEQATYRRGTSTATDTSIFENLVIFATTEPFDMPQGTASITIPADTMHSFDAPNNKIEWTLTIHGEIPWWPDVSASFSIDVLPLSARALHRSL